MKTALLVGLFCLPLSLTAAWACFALFTILWLSRMVRTGEIAIRRGVLDVGLAVFVVWAAGSVWTSERTADIWYNYVYLVGLYVLVYCCVTQYAADRFRTEQVIIALLSSAAVVCVIGLFQYVVGVDVTAERWIDSEQFPELKTRVFSTLGNPNVLAAFLIMTTGLSIGWSTDVQHRFGRPALLLVAVLSVVCTLLTYSRGAWLSLGVMGVLLVALWRRPGKRALWAGGLVFGVFLFFARQSLFSRIHSILGMFNPADSSVALRWALWESTRAMIGEHPWLGLGWGSYRFVYPEYDFFIQNPDVIIYHGHNTLLSLAAEIGLPGMLVFAAVWTVAALRSFQIMQRRKPHGDGKGLLLGLLLALLGMAAFSLTDHVLFNIQVTAVFWVLLALSGSFSETGSDQVPRFWIFKK